jgi:hypothetical protein
MQWFRDFAEQKSKPTNTIPGITYMLAGATQRSDSDPYDTTSKPIAIGPHWMIMWPFDAKTTGLPTTHKPTGAYIMWDGSPYAHVQITCIRVNLSAFLFWSSTGILKASCETFESRSTPNA